MLRVSNRRRLEDLLRASRVAMEALESRILFALPNPIIPTPILPVGTLPLQGIVGTPLSLDPFMFNTAFGFNAINFHLGNSVIHGDGTGQTIAIVDAFGSSTIINDSQVFNDHWGISNRDGQGNFFLTVQPLRPGQNTIGEPADKIAGWALETSLDVEWAHAVAPGAHILLVESPSDSLLDLVDSNVFAANWDTVTQTEDATPNGPGGRGVVVVSNSWGVADFAESFLYDGFFETPTGHLDANGNPGGITFLASSGDVGGQLQYPSASLNVFSVGGQTNSIDLSGNLLTRAPWTGSGGGGAK